MTNGQQLTGVSDPTYDLSSILYHAAKGGTVYAKYIEDAERAQRARELIAQRH